MNFLDENGLGRLWAQIILKLNSKVPDGGTTGQVLKKTETGTEWADESCAADAVQSNLDTHVNNTDIHVTAEEKSAWNAKLDSYTETDPTVPDWAKQSTKPTYTADEVGAAPASHVADTTMHVTSNEKSAWNESISVQYDAKITLPSTSISWKDITYGNGIFVAVGNDTDMCAYSMDGINWAQDTLPTSGIWNSVTYGNGMFVTVCRGSNVAAYSTDGINWTQITLPSHYNWEDIIFADGKFVSIGSGRVIYSTDAINWTENTLPNLRPYNVLGYGNGTFVAFRNNSNVAIYSTDAINWTENTLPTSSTWTSVAYGNGKFVAIANGKTTSIYSEDGITWTEGSALPTVQSNCWYSMIYVDNKFFAVPMLGTIAAYSEDGINWMQINIPKQIGNPVITYGDRKFILIRSSGDSSYSLDGITWSDTRTTLQDVSGANVVNDVKKILGLDKPITPESIGAATMAEVNAAIQTAIGNAIGGSY